MMPAIIKNIFAKDIEDENKDKRESTEEIEEIVNSPILDIKVARKFGGAVYLALTGYVKLGEKYVVQRESYIKSNRKRVIIVIESVKDAKETCQNWNEKECKDCDSLVDCELNKE